jgi:hypothetical protein
MFGFNTPLPRNVRFQNTFVRFLGVAVFLQIINNGTDCFIIWGVCLVFFFGLDFLLLVDLLIGSIF